MYFTLRTHLLKGYSVRLARLAQALVAARAVRCCINLCRQLTFCSHPSGEAMSLRWYSVVLYTSVRPFANFPPSSYQIKTHEEAMLITDLIAPAMITYLCLVLSKTENECDSPRDGSLAAFPRAPL